MQVHIIIYIRTPAPAHWYAYTGININMIGNLKSETRKPRHPSPYQYKYLAYRQL